MWVKVEGTYIINYIEEKKSGDDAFLTLMKKTSHLLNHTRWWMVAYIDATLFFLYIGRNIYYI